MKFGYLFCSTLLALGVSFTDISTAVAETKYSAESIAADMNQCLDEAEACIAKAKDAEARCTRSPLHVSCYSQYKRAFQRCADQLAACLGIPPIDIDDVVEVAN